MLKPFALASHASGITAAQLIAQLIGYLSLPIIVRLLPPDEYGRFVLLTTLITIALTVTIQWIQAAVSRSGSVAGDSYVPLRSFAWRAIASIATGVVCLILAVSLSGGTTATVSTLGVATLFVAHAAYVLAAERVYVRGMLLRWAWLSVQHVAIKAGVGILCASLVVATADALVIGWTVALVSCLLVALRYLPPDEWRRPGSPKALGTLDAYGARLAAANFFGITPSWAPVLVLWANGDAASVAAFSVIVLCVHAVVWLVPSALVTASYPSFLSLVDRGAQREARQALWTLLAWIGVYSAAAVAFVLLFGTYLVRLVGGTQYSVQASAGLLMLAAAAAAFMGTFRALDMVYKAELQSQRLLRVTGAAGALCIFANLTLIPMYGLVGAFAASMCAYLVLALLALRDVTRWGYLRLPDRS